MQSKTLFDENGDVEHTIRAWNKRIGEVYNEWGGSVERRRKHNHKFLFAAWDTWEREDPTIPISVTYSSTGGTTTGPLPPGHTETGYAEDKQWEVFVGSRTGSTVVSDIVGVRVDFIFNGVPDSVSDGVDWVGRFGWDVVFVVVLLLVIVVVGILLL